MGEHISKKMGLDIQSHSEIEFVDIVLANDTKLFIDPCLIEFGKDPWMVDAQITISNFMAELYKLYRRNAVNTEKKTFFNHVHEVNATKLGYGNGKNGHAKTSDGMVETLRELEKLMQSGIPFHEASDLKIFIKNYAEDCLSDMITNVLFEKLNNFTLSQCKKYRIEPDMITEDRYYWDGTTGEWTKYMGKSLIIDGKLVLLVPKNIVRKHFLCSANQYFSRIILEEIQKRETSVNTDGTLSKPTKKKLREKHQGESKVRDSATQFTMNQPNYLLDYHHQLQSFYRDKGMTDGELDDILYK